jgi:hypothetical protein
MRVQMRSLSSASGVPGLAVGAGIGYRRSGTRRKSGLPTLRRQDFAQIAAIGHDLR